MVEEDSTAQGQRAVRILIALAHSTSYSLKDGSHSIAERRSAIDLYCLCAGATQSKLSGTIACAGTLDSGYAEQLKGACSWTPREATDRHFDKSAHSTLC